jgi:hypothetical protein
MPSLSPEDSLEDANTLSLYRTGENSLLYIVCFLWWPSTNDAGRRGADEQEADEGVRLCRYMDNHLSSSITTQGTYYVYQLCCTYRLRTDMIELMIGGCQQKQKTRQLCRFAYQKSAKSTRQLIRVEVVDGGSIQVEGGFGSRITSSYIYALGGPVRTSKLQRKLNNSQPRHSSTYIRPGSSNNEVESDVGPTSFIRCSGNSPHARNRSYVHRGHPNSYTKLGSSRSAQLVAKAKTSSVDVLDSVSFESNYLDREHQS